MTRVYTQQIEYDEMKEYGEFFKSMRKSIKYTLKEMSNELGIALSTLHRWENAKIIPSEDIYEIECKIRKIVKSAKKAL